MAINDVTVVYLVIVITITQPILKERLSTNHKPHEHIQTLWDVRNSIFLADVQALVRRLR